MNLGDFKLSDARKQQIQGAVNDIIAALATTYPGVAINPNIVLLFGPPGQVTGLNIAIQFDVAGPDGKTYGASDAANIWGT